MRGRINLGINLGVALLALLIVAVAGCTSPERHAAPSPAPRASAKSAATAAAKREAARKAVPLSPGCPLGATAALGLNITEKGCNAVPRTRPAGPMGSPNLTP
jgi:hypothetical protein